MVLAQLGCGCAHPIRYAWPAIPNWVATDAWTTALAPDMLPATALTEEISRLQLLVAGEPVCIGLPTTASASADGVTSRATTSRLRITKMLPLSPGSSLATAWGRSAGVEIPWDLR